MSAPVRNILLAMCLFACMNVGVKALPGIPAHEIVFFRALVSLVVCWFLIRRAKLSPWGVNKPVLIARGLTGTVALTIFFYTLQTIPLATAVTLQHLSPIFSILLAGLIVREKPRPIQWLFFALAMAGVLLIQGFDASVSPLLLGLGVVSAFFSGLAYNCIRKLNQTDNALVVVFYFPLVTVPLIGGYTALHWVTPTAIEWLLLVSIGVCVTAAQIFMTRAFQKESAANIGIYTYLGIVLAVAFGWILFGEPLTGATALGIGMIVVSVLLSNRFRRVG